MLPKGRKYENTDISGFTSRNRDLCPGIHRSPLHPTGELGVWGSPANGAPIYSISAYGNWDPETAQ